MSPSPPALAWSTENCTVGRTMAILGERWTFVVLREVFNGVRRFDDIKRHSGIPRQVLSNRLAVLVEQGVLRREPYQDPGERARHEYRLTNKGFDLYIEAVRLDPKAERARSNLVHAALVLGRPVPPEAIQAPAADAPEAAAPKTVSPDAPKQETHP